MLSLFSAYAEKCDLLNPNACGLYDCGGNSWSPDETQGNGDNLSLRSGQVNMIGSSRVCMKVTGPGLVKFMWKVDPTTQHVGTLSLLVDNSPKKICDSQEWTPVSYSLRENKDYVLSWQFQKIKSYPEGLGAGWIDDLDVSNATRYSDVSVDQNNPYPNQKKSLDKHPMAENVSDSTQNLQREFSTSDGILISSSNVSIIVPNLSINISRFPNVYINISYVNANIANADNASSGEDIKGTDNPDLNKVEDAIVGKCNCSFGTESNRYESIEEAIEGVRTNGTVFICNGVYQGPIEIRKSLTIQGESNASTILNGSGNIIEAFHNNISIRNMRIMGNNIPNTCGAFVQSANSFSFLNNTIVNCSTGLDIQNSRYANITGNVIKRGINGINCSCSENKNKMRIPINLPTAII